MKITVVKTPGALRPADILGDEAFAKIKNGAMVMVEITRPRNLQHHRLYWALVAKVWDNIDNDRYPTVNDLHGDIKIAVGLRTRIELPDGTVGFMPGSIAWAKMGQDEFSAFYERVCDAVAKWFLPGVTSEDLRAEVESMIGIRTAVAAQVAVGAGAGAGGSAQVSAGGPPSPPQPAPAAAKRGASTSLLQGYVDDYEQERTRKDRGT